MDILRDLMMWIVQVGFSIYAYCTDFVICAANLTGLSYYEINAILFCFLYPFVLVLLVVLFMIQKRRYKALQR